MEPSLIRAQAAACIPALVRLLKCMVAWKAVAPESNSWTRALKLAQEQEQERNKGLVQKHEEQGREAKQAKLDPAILMQRMWTTTLDAWLPIWQNEALLLFRRY